MFISEDPVDLSTGTLFLYNPWQCTCDISVMVSHRDIALTHPPLLSHICVSIGSDNGLSPVQRQAITWTNACLLSNGPLGTNLSEIRTKIQNFLFKKMHFNMSPAKRRPLCPGRDELILCCHGHFVFVDQTFGWQVKVTTSSTFSALITW